MKTKSFSQKLKDALGPPKPPNKDYEAVMRVFGDFAGAIRNHVKDNKNVIVFAHAHLIPNVITYDLKIKNEKWDYDYKLVRISVPMNGFPVKVFASEGDGYCMCSSLKEFESELLRIIDTPNVVYIINLHKELE